MKLSLHWGAVSLVAGVIALAGGPDKAEAHVCMDYPVARGGGECVARSPQKVGPCGVAGRSEIVNVFRPGETIELILRETIDHPSHYRIGFNPDGESFPDPVALDDIQDEHELILIDGIEDADDAIQTVEVTFPAIECENCTLQLIQVMYDKQENGFGGRTADGGNDDMYYSCADIALRGAPVASNESTDGRGAGFPSFAAFGLIAAVTLVGAGRRKFKQR